MLLVQMNIIFSDRVWVEHAICAVIVAFRAVFSTYAAIDDKMSDMYALGMKFSGEGLAEAAQAKLAHGED